MNLLTLWPFAMRYIDHFLLSALTVHVATEASGFWVLETKVIALGARIPVDFLSRDPGQLFDSYSFVPFLTVPV